MADITIVTIVGSVIGAVGLALAVYTASWSLPRISKSMTLLQESMTLMQKRMSTAEVTADAGLMLTRISTLNWTTYKRQVQHEASNYRGSEECCLKLTADGTYALTLAGERLIDSDLRERIVDIRKLEPKKKEKDIVLALGVHELCEKAFSKDVPPNVLAGVVVTFVEQTMKAL